MGQGTSKYRKIMRTPQTGENAGKKLWYATAVSDREMSFEDFVTHISEHNSPYSRGTIHGVLMDTLDCLKHLILDGKSVRFSDLGLFSIGMTSRGEVSKEKVTAASVQGVHLIVRNTKTWSNAELKKLTKIVAYDDYTSGAEDGGGTENTPGGGGTSQGAGGGTSQGAGGETNKDNGGTSQGGGDTSQGGGGTDSGGDNVNF
ncbi:HU family DNA-binding protein [Segatella copri]|uniref:HU family DNA-binding protein n=1 Tax=Segatella copri TaxID=165179 RepID=UPI00294B05F0|nr:HU family DNA-binding protein [Segatella copri]